MDNSGKQRLVVPGFGLPINHSVISGDRYRSGVESENGGHYTDRWTAREIEMLSFMNAITDKPEWSRKVFDESIVARWRKEAEEKQHSLLSSVTLDWCIRELRDKAKRFEESSFVRCLDNEAAVIKSDTIVPEKLKIALKRACEPLQARPEEDQDWHPKSNKQVLNLVHPSLYAFVYEKSLVLPQGRVGLKDCLEFYGATKGITATPTEQREGFPDADANFCSRHFQWLPCEVEFRDDTPNDVLIKSYINNLHPMMYEDLYHVIEKFIAIAIPMWNGCLIQDQEDTTRRIHCDFADYDEWKPDFSAVPEDEKFAAKLKYLDRPDREGYEAPAWQDGLERRIERLKTITSPEDDDLRELADVLEQKWERVRRVIHPEPQAYDDWKEKVQQISTVKVQDFRDKGLQIIVKLSGIELTPEKPEYEGGSWHLEGMTNEHIVATAIYYYDCENITNNRLHFRQAALLEQSFDLYYGQGDHEGLEEIYGLKRGALGQDVAVQEIGSTLCKEGRLLCFPNYLQHKVGPFELKDRTKPGHRRFLVLWLVDPHYRILSTANVPPQQHSWWWDEALARPSMLSNLPTDILSMVIKECADFPMSLDEAKENRLQLMKERTVHSDQVNGAFPKYHLCEH